MNKNNEEVHSFSCTNCGTEYNVWVSTEETLELIKEVQTTAATQTCFFCRKKGLKENNG